MNSRRFLLPLTVVFLGSFLYLTKDAFAEEPSTNPETGLSAQQASVLKDIKLEWQLTNFIETINKSGIAVGHKFNEFNGQQDIEAVVKATDNDLCVAAAALLKANAIVSEIDDPQEKTDWSSIIENFENWLVALGRFSLAIERHDQRSQAAAVKEARAAYEAGLNSLDARIAAETSKQTVPGMKPSTQ
jgi:hypothetical protein